jgi:hypothetical protein
MPFDDEPHFARYSFNRMCGLHRAAFWATQDFPNLVRTRAAMARKREQRKLEEWQREELKRTPFAILDEPPPELAAVKRPHPRR